MRLQRLPTAAESWRGGNFQGAQHNIQRFKGESFGFNMIKSEFYFSSGGRLSHGSLAARHPWGLTRHGWQPGGQQPQESQQGKRDGCRAPLSSGREIRRSEMSGPSIPQVSLLLAFYH